MTKLLKHPAALCNIVRRIAIEAGELTLEYFDDSGFVGADAKSDGSPVTIADHEAEILIEKALLDLTPDVPIIGEEAFSQGRVPDLSSSEYFWLVDPLDGTKGFVSGSGDYTVNIALIHNGTPVLGVVYVPVKAELYAGHEQGSAVRWLEDTDNEKSISVRKVPANGMTVVASKSHGSADRMEEFLRDYKVAKLTKRGSSLKICAIAAGKADLYPRLAPTCEWDTAAGDAVLRAAGGMLASMDGKPFIYGRNDHGKFLNPEFIAASANVMEMMFGDNEEAAVS